MSKVKTELTKLLSTKIKIVQIWKQGFSPSCFQQEKIETWLTKMLLKMETGLLTKLLLKI